jgi:hypothetical protein
MDKFFAAGDEKSRKFYQLVFNHAMLNIIAVRRGLFDILLCETEDPSDMIRWKQAVPQIMEILGQKDDDMHRGTR